MTNQINQNKYHNLNLLNSTILPKWYNSIYSSEDNILIYPITSNIIIHNLSNDTKKIINNKGKNKISNIKYLDKDKNILLTISKSQFPKINIISLNPEDGNDKQNTYLYSKIIPIEENFSVSNIFIDRFRYNLFLIILSSIDKNILYFFHITSIDKNKYDIIPFEKLKNLELEIIDFKCFYNEILLICITRNSIIYYKLNLEKKICEFSNNIKFQFKLLPKSLKIDRKNGLIAMLTASGQSLIYDKEGNKIFEIICPINKEYFTFHIFSDYDNSICLSTNIGNIFIYKIDNYDDTFIFKTKNYIKYSFINRIINEKFLYNNNIYKSMNKNKNIISNNNKKNYIEIIYYNEKEDIILFTINNSISFLQIPLSSLINKNIKEDSNFIYNFNHSQKINNGIIIYNASSSQDKPYDNIIYSCSNDNILIKRYYNYSSNKFFNYYFDCSYLFKEPNTFITAIRFHPKYADSILYAGDNKGALYVINKDKNYQYQKYYLNKENNFNDDISIISIIFCPDNDYLIYIGFNNGMQRLYDLSVDKTFNYYILLTKGFLEKNEIDYRIKKSHVICFSHFFIYQYHLKEFIIYINNQNTIKISKIINIDDFNTINNYNGYNNYSNEKLVIKYEKILDIRMHKSENYIIVLNNQKQIIINELNYGNIISTIDLNKAMNYIYNIEIDISGLYLSLICDFKNSPLNSNKSSISIIELSTGQIKNYIKQTSFIITKTKFDYYGRFLITFGENGEISVWKFGKEIKNNIMYSIREIKKDFYNFWDNYQIKNYINIDKNNDYIIDEILEESLDIANKEKNYLDYDSYMNQEDFFRINNHGEKSINYNRSKSLNNESNLNNLNNNLNNLKNNSISIVDNDSIYQNNNNNIIIQTTSNNHLNKDSIDNSEKNKDNNNVNNGLDVFVMEDHYINRKSNNYKNSINYIATFRNNNKLINKNYETEKEKIIYNPYNKRNNDKKRSMSSNNSKTIVINNKKIGNISLTNNKSKSLRDIIMNKNTNQNNNIALPHITKNGNEITIKANGNTIQNNNYIETPHFLRSPHSQINSNKNNNSYNLNTNDIKNNLNLLSLTLHKNQSLNKENYKDIFDLKKKIILQSSALLHNERRMINLANAMNKKTFRNSSTNNNNYTNYSKEENVKNTSNSNLSNVLSMINTKRKNRNYNKLDKKIMFGNINELFKSGKYPEPDDIDMNLVNIKNENNTVKISRNNIIKIDKGYDGNNNYSNENLYFINNNKNNNNTSRINSNYFNNKSTSFSIIKDIQTNNNNIEIDKDNSNLSNINNYNINEITNGDNTSIGDQISYLENNILKFEKNFGNK